MKGEINILDVLEYRRQLNEKQNPLVSELNCKEMSRKSPNLGNLL